VQAGLGSGACQAAGPTGNIEHGTIYGLRQRQVEVIIGTPEIFGILERRVDKFLQVGDHNIYCGVFCLTWASASVSRRRAVCCRANLCERAFHVNVFWF
jgi:hypothetical protein